MLQGYHFLEKGFVKFANEMAYIEIFLLGDEYNLVSSRYRKPCSLHVNFGNLKFLENVSI